MSTIELVEHLKTILGIDTDASLAKLLGLTPAALGMLKKRNGSIADGIIQLAEREGLDLNLLFFGRCHPGDILQQSSREGFDLTLINDYLQSKGFSDDNILILQVKTNIPPLQIGDIAIIDTRETHITVSGIYLFSHGQTPILRKIIVNIDGSLQIPATSLDSEEKVPPAQAKQLQPSGRVILTLSNI